MPLNITEPTSALVGDVHIKNAFLRKSVLVSFFYLATSAIVGALGNGRNCTSASVEALDNHEHRRQTYKHTHEVCASLKAYIFPHPPPTPTPSHSQSLPARALCPTEKHLPSPPHWWVYKSVPDLYILLYSSIQAVCFKQECARHPYILLYTSSVHQTRVYQSSKYLSIYRQCARVIQHKCVRS